MNNQYLKNFYFILSIVWLFKFDGPVISQEAKENGLQQASDSELIVQHRIEIDEKHLFGFDLFNGNFKPVSFNNAFFPDSYRLGPGDKLGIYLSGKIKQDFEVIINVEGKIYIPTIGLLAVKGMTMDEFRSFLTNKIAQFYDNFVVDVLLIEPKSVQIAVVGEVKQPGKYLLTALNTVIDAVMSAGGPTEKGSLRNIQLYRDGNLVRLVDLYEFLLKPQYTDSNFLALGDRIFVPLIQAKVYTAGELNRTMAFELKADAAERLSDVIDLAGGFTEYAFISKIEVSRVQPDGERQVRYIDFNEIISNYDHPSNVILKNDDRIHVFSKLDQLNERLVYIHGEVKRPGEYVLEDNLRLSDLILKAGNLNRNAYMLEAEVAKVDPKTPTEFIKVDLQKLLNEHDSTSDIALEEDDRVFIRQIPEWDVGPTVELKGEVMFPGIYSINEDQTTLSEIMNNAGGFTAEALIREAKLIRKSAKITIDKEYERLKQMSRGELSESEYQYLVMKENTQDIGQIVVDFYKLMMKNDSSEDVLLEDGDVIVVPKKPNVVYVTGRVSKPGGVLFVPDKKFKYYLERAGGATWDAQVNKSKITKVSGEILDDEDVDDFRPGDIIWVPRKPDRDWWEVFRQMIAVAAQVATVYLVIDRAVN